MDYLLLERCSDHLMAPLLMEDIAKWPEEYRLKRHAGLSEAVAMTLSWKTWLHNVRDEKILF